MAQIEWNMATWRKVQGHIMEIENENSMENKEIQEKILEVVKEQND